MALTARITEDSGPLDPADLAKVFKILTLSLEDDPNGSRAWPFSEAISAIKFIHRVFSAELSLRASMAGRFLAGPAKSPGVMATRPSDFTSADAVLLIITTLQRCGRRYTCSRAS